MNLLNTYARPIASPEFVNGKPYPTLLAVLTAGGAGDRAVYLGIVTLPEPVNKKYDEARMKAAEWVAHSGTKIRFEEAKHYFDVDLATYRA